MRYILRALVGIMGYLIFHTFIYSEPTLLILLILTLWYDIENREDMTAPVQAYLGLTASMMGPLIVASLETLL